VRYFRGRQPIYQKPPLSSEADTGPPIGPNDTAIAGHVIAARAILVTNNVIM